MVPIARGGIYPELTLRLGSRIYGSGVLGLNKTGNISKAKHAIDIATKSVALGGAIYLAASTGNIPLVIGAAGELIDVIQETQKG